MLIIWSRIFCYPVFCPKIRISRQRKIIISPVVLYGCKSRSLTLRENRRLKVSENRVLRRVFGSKRDEVTREWRKIP